MNRVTKLLGLLSASIITVGLSTTGSAQSFLGDVSKQDRLKSGTTLMESSFMENKGQWDSRALFMTRDEGLNTWVTRDGFVLDAYELQDVKKNEFLNTVQSNEAPVTPNLKRRVGHVVSFRLENANKRVSTSGTDAIQTRIDFLGLNTPSVKDVKAYREAFVQNQISGLTTRFYRDEQTPRYDLILAPGANPNAISFRITGAQSVSVDTDGSLRINTSIRSLFQRGLYTFQETGRSRQEVDSAFKVKQDGDDFILTIEVGKYDRSKPLIIDPLVYGTHFGGNSEDDEILDATSDASGSVYFTGYTAANDFPVTDGPYGIEVTQKDGFVSALQGEAYDLSYSAFITGAGQDLGRFIEVDQYGNLWVALSSESSGAPTGLAATIRQTPATTAPTGGTFQIVFRGQTVDAPWNATSAQVKTLLDGMPLQPVGGFTVTGGPLPATPIVVTAPNDLGYDTVTVNSRMKPFVIESNTPAPVSSQFLRLAREQFGFTPAGGTFRLTLNDGAPANSNTIAWNAGNITTQSALRAIPALAGTSPVRVAVAIDTPIPPPVIPNTNTLVEGRLRIDFTTAAGAPEPRNLLTVDATAITSSSYQIAPPAGGTGGKAVIIRFQRVGPGILDPLSAPVSKIVSGLRPYVEDPMTGIKDYTGLTGFSIRPGAGATGNVELAVVGSTATVPGTISEVTATPPVNPVRGFYLTLSYPGTGSTVTTLTARSGYVGGTVSTQINDASMDQDGSLYICGDIFLPAANPANVTNAILGNTSSVFRTTTGTYANGNLLRGRDGFVRKYGPTGTLIFSATLGGSNSDRADAIKPDIAGNMYVLSRTNSFNFPRTVNAYDQAFSNTATNPKLAITKLNSSGTTLSYSSGMTCQPILITAQGDPASETDPNVRVINSMFPFKLGVDSKGNAYAFGSVARGLTGPLPMITTPSTPQVAGQVNALDRDMSPGDLDAAIIVMNSTATGLLYSSFIGRDDSSETAFGIDIDKSGGVLLVGGTTPRVAPSTTGYGLNTSYLSTFAYKNVTDQGGLDGFLVKLKLIQPILLGVATDPESIAGGLGAKAELFVALRNVATANTTLTLRISNPSVARFDSENGLSSKRVTILAGEQFNTSTIEVFSRLTVTPTFVDIRAELDGDFVQTRLNVRPWLDGFILGVSEIPGGEEVTGTVSLFQPAPVGGMPVNLSADDPAISFAGGSNFIIPEGEISANFQILTAGVDADQDVNITATVAGVGITNTLKLTPPLLQNLDIAPDRISGGESSQGTVRIVGVAGPATFVTISQAGSTTVTITDENPGLAGVQVQVPQGQDEKTFDIQTSFVSSNSSVVLTALLNGDFAQDSLFIEATEIIGMTLTPSSVVGGNTSVGRVTLSRATGQTGLRIPLINSNPAACTISGGDPDNLALQNVVVVPAGATTATFQIVTNPVSGGATALISTNKPGYAVASALLTIQAVNVSFSFTLTPQTLTGGATSRGRVTLATASPIDLTFNITSNNAFASPAVSTVTIPAGLTFREFDVLTSLTGTTVTSNITVELFGQTQTKTLTILPPAIQSFSLSPTLVLGGSLTNGTSTATVRLDQPAPTGGIVINYTSNQPAFVYFGTPGTTSGTITIPAGSRDGTFQVKTNPVTRQIGARISATAVARNQTFTALLTINPAP